MLIAPPPPPEEGGGPAEGSLQISSINHRPGSNVTNILQLEETAVGSKPSISPTHDHPFIGPCSQRLLPPGCNPPHPQLRAHLHTLPTYTHTHTTYTHTYTNGSAGLCPHIWGLELCVCMHRQNPLKTDHKMKNIVRFVRLW